MTKPPSLSGQAGRELDFQKKMARLRAATGRPERRTVNGRCSAGGGAFQIVFDRLDPAAQFKISSITKLDAEARSPAVARDGGSTDAESFSVLEFDTFGWTCPCCGDKSGWIRCNGCRTTYCGACRACAADGSDRFTCPTCKTTAKLHSATEIHGARGRAEIGGKGSQNKLLSQAKTLFLPFGGRK
ncbi:MULTISPECIES: hypothetical protein [unclassified Mesorhizobium]|uniref:hypothetical protein n=1 Tax=unclassified Mesorhizobium TaxID=325217 RepID=UPI001127CA69|nr:MULTISPECIES: hypothetical protein [unclassified Mesorhizobium]MBZ9701591.1 hypothetical protein [Mesorhizobium sp. CO1-1-3]MBZ9949201.1 hypothetical protein [Mesorhizobium sp. BR1-1-11]TPI99601.1 hypothetical protein FJ428_21965 [Mesorhizobium sp. B2-8-1]